MRLSHTAGFRNSILAARECEIRRQSLILRQSVKTRVLGGGWAIIALVMASILLMSGTAMATMIPLGGGGEFNGGGLSVQVNGAGAGVGGPCINFFNGTSPDACPPSSPNTFLLDGPSDPIFGTVGTTTGTTNDFVMSQQGSTAPGNQPYSGGTAFLTLNGFTFDILTIAVPNVIACPPGLIPGSCSAGNFVLTQEDLLTSGPACPGGTGTCGHVDVGFSATGIGYSGSSATGSTVYTFTWSSHFNNETTTDLITKANTGTLGITNSVAFVATPTAAVVPEPGALLLVGAGLLVMGRGLRRKRA
jgi:hypothetical protein